MRTINQESFGELIKKANIKPRLKRELRFVASTANMAPEDWLERELMNITDRTGVKGVLLLEPDDKLFILPYELFRGLSNPQTGRSNPVICDFCRTWQGGGNAARISFHKDPQSINSVTFLCCADLACSNHVRTKTKASIGSRAQLREDLTNEQRVERLKDGLRNFINEMGAMPIVG
jgi:hypothetical protein